MGGLIRALHRHTSHPQGQKLVNRGNRAGKV